MPRVGLTPDTVVEIALGILDETGDVTLAGVASRAGVATPSLYKHVAGLAELRELMAVHTLTELNDQLVTASLGRAGPDAVSAAMRAWRDYVLQHPHRYAVIPLQPLGEERLAPAAKRLLDTANSVLRAFRLSPEETVHATRALRVIVHGFATLEAAGGFGLPEDLEESFDRMVDMFLASMPPPNR